jgi:hypothetical protein
LKLMCCLIGTVESSLTMPDSQRRLPMASLI